MRATGRASAARPSTSLRAGWRTVELGHSGVPAVGAGPWTATAVAVVAVLRCCTAAGTSGDVAPATGTEVSSAARQGGQSSQLHGGRSCSKPAYRLMADA